jgi:cell division GTPase FtsZ
MGKKNETNLGQKVDEKVLSPFHKEIQQLNLDIKLLQEEIKTIKEKADNYILVKKNLLNDNLTDDVKKSIFDSFNKTNQ